MKLPKIVTVAAFCIAATGCCKCDLFQKKYGKPLVGTQWQLVQIEGRDITPSDNYTIKFASDNTMSGIADCNRLMAKYTATEKGSMAISNVGSTRMACPDMEQEQRFISVLESTTNYKMDGPMLILISDGEMRAIFQAIGAEMPPSK